MANVAEPVVRRELRDKHPQSVSPLPEEMPDASGVAPYFTQYKAFQKVFAAPPQERHIHSPRSTHVHSPHTHKVTSSPVDGAACLQQC